MHLKETTNQWQLATCAQSWHWEIDDSFERAPLLLQMDYTATLLNHSPVPILSCCFPHKAEEEHESVELVLTRLHQLQRAQLSKAAGLLNDVREEELDIMRARQSNDIVGARGHAARILIYKQQRDALMKKCENLQRIASQIGVAKDNLATASLLSSSSMTMAQLVAATPNVLDLMDELRQGMLAVERTGDLLGEEWQPSQHLVEMELEKLFKVDQVPTPEFPSVPSEVFVPQMTRLPIKE